MSLQDWVNLNKLKPEPSSPAEIRDLLALVARNLKDCQASGVSIDQRFKTAYEAALVAAKTALRACGYKTVGGGKDLRQKVEKWLKANHPELLEN